MCTIELEPYLVGTITLVAAQQGSNGFGLLYRTRLEPACYSKGMNITEKIIKSKSREIIDFSKIGCLDQHDPLVIVEPTEKIIVEPNWTIPGEYEGSMYAEYRKEHPEYDTVYTRTEVLKRLHHAANSLEDEYKLVIRAGHRPLDVQKAILNGCKNDYLKDNPGATEEDALEHARTFVDDPDIQLPSHCCAIAVDVYLIDVQYGKSLDFGTEMNDYNERSYLYAEDITDLQKINRDILINAMLDAGFASCYSEWWHFSYGDQIWAWFYGKKDCLYGLINL